MHRTNKLWLVILLFIIVASGCTRKSVFEERFLCPDKVKSTYLSHSIDVQRAFQHIRHLSQFIGPRPAGSKSESYASYYIAKKLKEAGCCVSFEPVNLPGKRTSTNIVGLLKGCGNPPRKVVVIGAHYDSKPNSPGANDNASGVSVMLEIARLVPKRKLPFDLIFIGFGAEEIIDTNPDHHHYGSRQYVQNLSEKDVQRMVAMLSIDMVGAGKNLQIGNCSKKNLRVVNRLCWIAKSMGIKATYFKNSGSDHEAFEKAGVPVAHIRWHPYTHYHKPSDTTEHISTEKLSITGSLVLRWLESLCETGNPSRSM
jgi:Zn-dependent M28 family amino/carboxypeptidase